MAVSRGKGWSDSWYWAGEIWTQTGGDTRSFHGENEAPSDFLAFPETCHRGQLSAEGICRQKEKLFCQGEEESSHEKCLFLREKRWEPVAMLAEPSWPVAVRSPEGPGRVWIRGRLQMNPEGSQPSSTGLGRAGLWKISAVITMVFSLRRKTVLFNSNRHTEKRNDKNNDQKGGRPSIKKDGLIF